VPICPFAFKRRQRLPRSRRTGLRKAQLPLPNVLMPFWGITNRVFEILFNKMIIT
jgi:hypothetical protein